MIIREITQQDLSKLLHLYTHLHGNPVPAMEPSLEELWRGILLDPNHHILTAWKEDELVSSCVLVIIPNLTHNQRPYGLIENIITHPDCRGRGYATCLLEYAKEIATYNNCYKIMLLTGSKLDSTLSFYQRAGYNRDDKTGFIQWLD